MKVSAIIYTSNTGFTRRYAQMLGEALHLPLYRLEEAGRKVSKGAPVLYLGWLCAGGLKGFKKARRRWCVRAVCAVGMTPKDQFDSAKLAIKLGLDEPLLFYLRGGYAPAQLTGFYKLVMAPLSRAVARAPAATDAERAMRDAFAHGGDWVSIGSLQPVVDWLAQ